MNEKRTCDELCRELHRKVLTSDTYVCMHGPSVRASYQGNAVNRQERSFHWNAPLQ